MNLSSLIKQYFPSSNNEVTIDVFDEKNIYDKINDSLYKCNCLDELRNILIEYVYDNYLINLDSTFD